MAFTPVAGLGPANDDDNAEMSLDDIKALAGKTADDDDVVQTADDVEDPDLEVIDDTPAEDRGKKVAEPTTPADDFVVTEAELASYRAQRTQERIKTLARKGHEERRAKEEALRQQAAAVEYAKTLHAQMRQLTEQHTQVGTAYVTSAKDAAEARLEKAKRDYQEAFETADPAKIAEAQVALNRISIELSQVPKAPPPAPKIPDPPAMQEHSPRLAEWTARNSGWFMKDRELTELAMGFHKLAIRQGIPVDSDSYYSFIDQKMSAMTGGSTPASVPDKQTPQNQPKRQAPPTAPVNSGSGAPARTSSSDKITLSKSEVAIARQLGVSLKDYAKQKQLRERGSENV